MLRDAISKLTDLTNNFNLINHAETFLNSMSIAIERKSTLMSYN